MATNSVRHFPVPPTYAEPTIVDPNSGKAQFNPIWLKWFLDVAQFLSTTAVTNAAQLDHNALGDLQGGAPGNYQHLTTAQIASFGIPITSPGEILIGDSAGHPVALAAGADGSKLTMTGGFPTWI